ncbi:MAG: hypothetical protein JWM02_1661 [Frankiales bacterium]|nr:hypothetical protein [Frankiales bacterium]
MRLHAIERELRRDPQLVAAFAFAGWMTPRPRFAWKAWAVGLLVIAILGVGVALSPPEASQPTACVPANRAPAMAPHAYLRPCT